jgi:hypothetical protein
MSAKLWYESNLVMSLAAHRSQGQLGEALTARSEDGSGNLLPPVAQAR